MRIKSLLVMAVLVTAILCFGGVAKTQAVDNSAQIAQLIAQIAQLQAQLQALQAQQQGGQAWCHTFNAYSVAGSVGVDVSYLQTALTKEGFDVSGDAQGTFEDNTAAAVVSFQGKYGIRQTGTVGPITRAKLNSLYGCSSTPAPTPIPSPTPAPTPNPTPTPVPTASLPPVTSSTQPSITVTSPHAVFGGETWKAGETHSITWSTTPLSNSMSVNITLISSRGLHENIVVGVPIDNGSYSWSIPSFLPAGPYIIQVVDSSTGQYANSSYFNIIASTPATSSTLPTGSASVSVPTFASPNLSVAIAATSNPRELSNTGTDGVYMDLGTFRFGATNGAVSIKKLNLKKLGTLPNSAIKSIWLQISRTDAPMPYNTTPIVNQIVGSFNYIAFPYPITNSILVSNNYFTDVTVKAMVAGSTGDTIGIGIDSAAAIGSNANLQTTTFPLNNSLVTQK